MAREPKKDLEKNVRSLGDSKYEISSFSELDTKYVVDVEFGTCTCIAYEMSKKKTCKHILHIQTLLGQTPERK
jgi:predicted nucleic acid-binding Zn finger protein